MAENPEQMRDLAKDLGAYIYKKFVEPELRKTIRYFKAAVIAAPTGGKVLIQRPFDQTQLLLPHAGAASNLQVGDQCLVAVFGDLSNAFVICDAALQDLGGGTSYPLADGEDF